jgi:hypothetical protein
VNSCLSVRRNPNLLVSGFYPQLGFFADFFLFIINLAGRQLYKDGWEGGGGSGQLVMVYLTYK